MTNYNDISAKSESAQRTLDPFTESSRALWKVLSQWILSTADFNGQRVGIQNVYQNSLNCALILCCTAANRLLSSSVCRVACSALTHS